MSDHRYHQLHNGFLLHRRDYSNSSLLVECFSPELGRFPAIAKGAKSSHSSKQGLLQPFQPLLFGISGRGEVRTLTRVEADGKPISLTGVSVFCAFYTNELLQRLLGREDPHAELYQSYQQTLYDLAAGSLPSERVLRTFELRLLDALGYGLQLEFDSGSGAAIQPTMRYEYRLEEGPVACPEQKVAGQVVSGETLLGLARGQVLDAVSAREARDLMRRILQHYLGSKPLKSRELFLPVGSTSATGSA